MARRITRDHVEAALWEAGINQRTFVDRILGVVDDYVQERKASRGGKVTRDHVEAALWEAGLNQQAVVDRILSVVDDYVRGRKEGHPPYATKEGHPPYARNGGGYEFPPGGGFIARLAAELGDDTRARTSAATIDGDPASIPTKQCHACREVLPVTEYYLLGKGAPGSRRAKCKRCDLDTRRARWARQKVARLRAQQC